jgi:hypothetical protein
MTTDEKKDCPERKAYIAGNHARWVDKNRERVRDHQKAWQKKVGWANYMKEYTKKRNAKAIAELSAELPIEEIKNGKE